MKIPKAFREAMLSHAIENYPNECCGVLSGNRNFEGRQGRGGLTHLVGPAMAAAAAVSGRLIDVRDLSGE